MEKKQDAKTSYLAIFGSGEISSIGRRTHEYILKHIGKKKVKIVLVTTPAGFQPNVDIVYGEIATFFKTSLINFHPDVKIIFANNRNDANNKDIISPIHEADYIFMGPGSPTYTVTHLRDTLLLNAITKQIKNGASLGLSSAAVIAFSKYCLPVYEIYKVGSILYWEKGLDFYSDIYRQLSVIPHFNNTEGGEKTDTSHCFMGKDRFQKLLKKLPVSEPLISLDEQTSVLINVSTKEVIPMGKGTVKEIEVV